MDAKSIREAAERRRKYVNGDDEDWSLLYENAEADDDTMDLADAYLADNPADDGEEYDQDWLWAVSPRPAGIWAIGYGKDGVLTFMVGGSVVISDCSNNVHLPGNYRTRGDVRRLCKALGITLKETV